MTRNTLCGTGAVFSLAAILMCSCGSGSGNGPKDTLSTDADSANTPDIVFQTDAMADSATDSFLNQDKGQSDWSSDLLDDFVEDIQKPYPPFYGPCSVGTGDCSSGLCELHLGDGVCTTQCLDTCPEDWTCDVIYVSGPDPMFVCRSMYPSLCLPCRSSLDCLKPTEKCVWYPGSEGTRCASACEDNSDCPKGYVCSDAESVEGSVVRQCVASTGKCACSSWATERGLSSLCARANGYGTCRGYRSCTDDGLTDCDAPDAVEEICFNNIDDDCNGQTDDAALCLSCVCGDKICDSDLCQEQWTPNKLECAVDCAVCGEGHCDPGEGPTSCPADCCGACGDGTCRRGICGESDATCPADCSSPCGDTLCAQTEDAVLCPADCPPGTCGNNTCDPDEDSDSCSADCLTSCGDCVCSSAEYFGSCPVDCGFCGDGFCLATCSKMYTPENLDNCFADCCKPDCQSKVCGNDGCGGSCGLCPDHHVCSADGSCLCVPECGGLECGNDSCGGSCGNCAPGQLCDKGICLDGCVTSATCNSGDVCVNNFCEPNRTDELMLLEPQKPSGKAGDASPQLKVIVTEPGLTGLPGAPQDLVVELSRAPLNVNPGLNPSQSQWMVASWVQDSGESDVFGGNLPPLPTGTYQFTFRAAIGAGPWTYADATGLADGFDPDAIGAWTLVPPPAPQSVSPKAATVLGGDTVSILGSGFATSGIKVLVDGVDAQVSVSTAEQITFVAPAHSAGLVAVTVVNPDGQSSVLNNALEYVLRFTPTVDGNISEWTSPFLVGSNTLESSWDKNLNQLENLYVAFDSQNLYFAIKGKSESFNYIIGYVDVDFGASSGTSEMVWLSDNGGNGDLDDALSSVLDVSVPTYGAEWGFGTRGMASFTKGQDLALSTYVGWRQIGVPYNLPWIQGWVLASSGAIEAALPLATAFPSGLPGSGSKVAVFVRLTDRYAAEVGLSNQSLPQYFIPGSPADVGAVASFSIILP